MTMCRALPWTVWRSHLLYGAAALLVAAATLAHHQQPAAAVAQVRTQDGVWLAVLYDRTTLCCSSAASVSLHPSTTIGYHGYAPHVYNTCMHGMLHAQCCSALQPFLAPPPRRCCCCCPAHPRALPWAQMSCRQGHLQCLVLPRASCFQLCARPTILCHMLCWRRMGWHSAPRTSGGTSCSQ